MLVSTLTYNGYHVEDKENNSLRTIELVNYGYIEDNYSEVVVRRYHLEGMEFISEVTYYKGSMFYKSAIATYNKLVKEEENLSLN